MEINECEACKDIVEYKEIYEMRIEQPRIYRRRIDPFEIFTDREFRRMYRFTKRGARHIIEIFKSDMRMSLSDRGKPIGPELKILCALSGFARGRVQEDTARLHGVSQASMSRINLEVAQVIARKMTIYIKFPESVEEQLEAMRHFKEVAGMPLIIGAIDCSHIRIKKTGGPLAQTYINRKGYYSLNVQAISDAHCKFINIVAKWRGSTHDSRIFQESVIGQRFENNDFMGKLVGDSGYRSAPYMLTPVPNPTGSQNRYNKAQIVTRNVVERLFGQWKQRFRGLLRGLSESINTVKVMIVAMAILHNISSDIQAEQKDWSDSEDDEPEDNDLEDDIQIPGTTVPQNNFHRNTYIRQYF